MPKVNAGQRARRMLAILHLFKSGAEIPLEAIADAIDATPEEVAADLELLACCGVGERGPVDLAPILVEDGRAIVFGDMPALDRAVRLSASEARALATALQSAGLGVDHELTRKLLEAASGADAEWAETLRSEIRTGEAPDRLGSLLKTASLALERSEVLAMSYHAAGREAPSSRLIEPMALLNDRGAWYIEAFCRTAGALRTFKLERVRSLELTGEQFTRRALSPTGSAFVTGGLPMARLRLAPGEELSEREWPGLVIVEQGTDGAVVEVPYAGTEWITRRVAARLGRVEVLSPAEIRRTVAALASAELAAL